MTSYLRKAIKSSIIIYSFAIIGALFGYFVRILFARNLTVAQYGLFYAVYGLITLVILLRGLGLGTAITRFIPEFKIKKQYSEIKSSLILTLLAQLFFSAVILVLSFAFADYLAIHYFRDPLASMLIKLVVTGFTIKSLVDTIRWGFLGFQKFFEYSAINQLAIFAVFIISYILFKMDMGIAAPALAYLIYPIVFSAIFLPIFLFRVFPQYFSSKLAITRKLIKKLMSFSLPQIVTDSSNLIMGQIDTVMLTLFVGVAGVGIYNVALPSARITLFLGEGLGIFLLPFVSELWTRKHKAHLRQGLSFIYKYFLIIALPVAFVLFSFSDMVITLLFGQEYLMADMSLKILAIGMLGFIVYFINSQVISGIDRPKTNAIILGTAIVFNILANLIFIRFFNITGVAMATALSYLLMMVMSFFYIRKHLKIALPIFYWIKVTLVSIFTVVVIYWLRYLLALNPYLEAALILIIAGMIYLGILFMFRLLDIKEIKETVRMILKKG